ncbi:hypothetical protein OE88DRAFT_1808811 [Heliocybe sulcata]|uniref:Yeast cell wall synthesis Kre9/Knh1-like N-terminal domain-containing protein n=1 Tax=Heliocybe sulcata TaxID=5364 RepID=A0A5C3N9J4_9AGAM|nr:hypothetical protein OE88DRAFT_1808811 [Heliocybe sulcata]
MLATMFPSFAQTLLVLATSSLASAAFYPTQPIADTVYSAGHAAFISWTDDGPRPHLGNMGNVSIDLYGQDEYLATLAEAVPPTSKSVKVHIPPNIGSSRPDYILRFVCKDPPLTIYTANFRIRPTPPTSSLSTSQASDTQSRLAPTPTNNMQPFFLTLVTPNSTVVSELPPRPTPTPVTTFYAGDERYDTPSGPGELQPKTKFSASRSAVVDLEKLKFRIVFILWPALMGITMSI